MNIDLSIFKAYDIRGIYPSQINEENYPTIIKAIYTFFVQDLKKENLTIVLARDMRVSSPSLFELAKKTLVEMGATVVDIGLASTPTFYYAVANYGYDAGIQVSASHNPKEYNGIKFAKNTGGKLTKIGKITGMEKVKKLVQSQEFVAPKEGGKTIVNDHVLQDEIKSAMESVGAKEYKKLKVVVDPANAMGVVFLEELFKHIPMEVVKMNFELDGTFPSHEPNPLKFKNLVDLQKKVIEEKADLGIAPDGDGDRVFFINEKGEVIKATSVTSLVAHEILEKTQGEIITADIRDILNVKEVCRQLGGKFTMCIVGHAYITEQLNREGAAFAGESSGHFFFRETGGGESSIRVILYMLKALSEQNKPISEILSQYISAYEHEEINFVISPPADPQAILNMLENDYKDGKVYKDDGLSVDYADWRFNVRLSNTENEPILRVNVEGKNKELVDQKFAEIEQKMLAAGGKHQ